MSNPIGPKSHQRLELRPPEGGSYPSNEDTPGGRGGNDRTAPCQISALWHLHKLHAVCSDQGTKERNVERRRGEGGVRLAGGLWQIETAGLTHHMQTGGWTPSMARTAAGTVQTPSPAIRALATIIEYSFSLDAFARLHR